MDINERMKAKMAELEAAETKREALFEDFEGNKVQIESTYYENERLKLEYLLLKREQLQASKMNETRTIILSSIADAENINENCISILQRNLADAGHAI
ncbi:hypothetical protein D3C75_579410 [compost metagenome]